MNRGHHSFGIPGSAKRYWHTFRVTDDLLCMNNTDRREFLKNTVKGTVVLGVGLSSLSLLTTAQAADKSDVNMPGDKKPVTNEELFRMGVIGPAELSLISSKLALEKATDKDVKEFAGF